MESWALLPSFWRPWGTWGASWEGLGRLFGVLGAPGGGPGRGLREPWKALEGLARQRSKVYIRCVSFWGVKMVQKSLKIVFKNELVFRRGSVNAFDRFVMNSWSFMGSPTCFSYAFLRVETHVGFFSQGLLS